MKSRIDSHTLDEVARVIKVRFNHKRDIGDSQCHGVASAAQAIADNLLETREERVSFLQDCGCAFISGYPDRG